MELSKAPLPRTFICERGILSLGGLIQEMENESAKSMLKVIAAHFPQALVACQEFARARNPIEVPPLDFAMLVFLACHPKYERHRGMLSHYFGAFPSPTLMATGIAFGRTQERIRQVTSKYNADVQAFMRNFWNAFGSWRPTWLPPSLNLCDGVALDVGGLLELVPGNAWGVSVEMRVAFLEGLLADDFKAFPVAGTTPTVGVFVRKTVLKWWNWESMSAAVVSIKNRRYLGLQQWAQVQADYLPVALGERERAQIGAILSFMLRDVLGIILVDDLVVGKRTPLKLFDLQRERFRMMATELLRASPLPIYYKEIYVRLGGAAVFSANVLRKFSYELSHDPDVVAIGLSGYYCHVAQIANIPALGPWTTYGGVAIHALQSAKRPLHISEFEQTVLQFHETNRNNIVTSLQSLQDTDLVSIGGGFWGLKSLGHQKFQFKKVPVHLYQLLDKMLEEYGPKGMKKAALYRDLKAKYGLEAVQIDDWLAGWIAKQRYRVEEDRIFGMV